jgi:EpsI family protein
MTPKPGSLALGALLVAVGAFAWWLELRPSLAADTEPLRTLPRQIGPWRSVDVPLESEVEAALDADFNLQRAYSTGTGDVIWLYVGYYGTERGGRPQHTPRGCYTGAGWGIRAVRALDAAPGGALRVNEYWIERDGEQRLVHYWYRSHRRTGMLGGLDQNLDRLLGRLLDGRADGALVRVSAPLYHGGEVETRGKLLAFAAAIDPLLGERWPRETPGARSSRAAILH